MQGGFLAGGNWGAVRQRACLDYADCLAVCHYLVLEGVLLLQNLVGVEQEPPPLVTLTEEGIFVGGDLQASGLDVGLKLALAALHETVECGAADFDVLYGVALGCWQQSEQPVHFGSATFGLRSTGSISLPKSRMQGSQKLHLWTRSVDSISNQRVCAAGRQ